MDPLKGLLGEKTTRRGRVVYNRKKHEYDMKDVSRVLVTLSNNDIGNAGNWRYVMKIGEMNYVGRMVPEGLLRKAVDALLRLQPIDRSVDILWGLFGNWEHLFYDVDRIRLWSPWLADALLSMERVMLQVREALYYPVYNLLSRRKKGEPQQLTEEEIDKMKDAIEKLSEEL